MNNEDPNRIVYIHNFKNIVTITRTAGGEWNYTYRISDIFDALNKYIPLYKDKFKPHLQKDMWDAGKTFGYKVNDLLRKCRLEYGDPETDEN